MENRENLSNEEQRKHEAYLEAEKRRLEAKKRPPKPHGMKLVYFVVEEDGEVLPVYTRDNY